MGVKSKIHQILNSKLTGGLAGLGNFVPALRAGGPWKFCTGRTGRAGGPRKFCTGRTGRAGGPRKICTGRTGRAGGPRKFCTGPSGRAGGPDLIPNAAYTGRKKNAAWIRTTQGRHLRGYIPQTETTLAFPY